MEHSLIGLRSGIGFGIRHRQRHRKGHQPRAVKAGIDCGEIVDRLHKQARAGDEHHGERHLGNHQPTAREVPPGAACTSPSLLERSCHAACSAPFEGHETEKQCGANGEAQRYQQNR